MWGKNYQDIKRYANICDVNAEKTKKLLEEKNSMKFYIF